MTVRLNLQASAFSGELRQFEGLIEFGVNIHRRWAIFGLGAGKAGKVLNDGGHSLPMLDDVFRVGFHLCEIVLLLDRLTQAQDSKERIIQLVPDSGAQDAETRQLLRVDELVLEPTFIGCVA